MARYLKTEELGKIILYTVAGIYTIWHRQLVRYASTTISLLCSLRRPSYQHPNQSRCLQRYPQTETISSRIDSARYPNAFMWLTLSPHLPVSTTPPSCITSQSPPSKPAFVEASSSLMTVPTARAKPRGSTPALSKSCMGRQAQCQCSEYQYPETPIKYEGAKLKEGT